MVLTGWAGGETDYSQAPFTMYMKSMMVSDYSTGTSYSYSDKSGSWKSIRSEGGQINGNSIAEPKSTETAPSVTATVDSIPAPWSGTHMETASYTTPDVWPWVATGSPAASSTGFPKGWKSGSGRVHPPSRSSVSEHSPTPSSRAPQSSISKTGHFISQSSFRFSSRPLAASSAAFSRSGHESFQGNVTRTAMSTTLAPTESATGETSTLTAGASITTNGISSPSAHAAPSVQNSGSMYRASVIVGGFSALLGVFALL